MDLGGKVETAEATGFGGEGRRCARAHRWHHGKENEERSVGARPGCGGLEMKLCQFGGRRRDKSVRGLV